MTQEGTSGLGLTHLTWLVAVAVLALRAVIPVLESPVRTSQGLALLLGILEIQIIKLLRTRARVVTWSRGRGGSQM